MIDHFSPRFFLGIVFIVTSLVLGKVTFALFLLFFRDPANAPIGWASLGLYILTWPMLILGIWWAGKEYYESIKRYVTYRYYHESVKAGTKKVYRKTKELHTRVKAKFHRKNSTLSSTSSTDLPK